jgi:hypothetical protein
MKTLEDELPTLSELSEHRKRAKKLRDDGLKALERITSQGVAYDSGWRMSRDKVESALVSLVQSKDALKRRELDEESPFVVQLTNLKLEELFGIDKGGSLLRAVYDTREEHKNVPVMVATRAMQALIVSSKYAFSSAALLCYYRIVRELYSADSPDWSTGGIRAGNGGESTAFMTGEGVRAVSALARTHRQTSIFFRSTYRLYQRQKHLRKLSELEKWRDVEIERVGLAWYTSTASQLGELALNLPIRKVPAGRIDTEYVDDYLKNLAANLKDSIISAKKNFVSAAWQARAFRKKERLAAKQLNEAARVKQRQRRKGDERYNRSETAHRIAYSVLRQAVVRANKALKICREEQNILDGLKQLSDLFKVIDCDIKRILEPARRFLGASLDRELTAASATSQSFWDARELVFAAASYGSVINWTQDARLPRACALLSEALSERGMLAPGRPFHTMDNGFSLYPSSFEVARGFAQLIHRTEFPVSSQLVRRMLQLFEDHSLPLEEAGAEPTVCWHAEDPPIPRRPTVWVTSVAVLALSRIVRMLDHQINERVLEHFSTVRYDKDETGLRLEDLSFPDYALCPLPRDIMRELRPEQQRKWSVAITLEQMRAHVLGTTLPESYPKAFSGVLFGPPGTGKTTLLKALASSSKRPLVQITPSDIARFGEQWIEKSAKLIFDALSMLTQAVIIFDEFEPILLKRETGDQKETRNIFTFLTPGMLPKITKLYEAAEQQGIAYCLVTNHYKKLDEAAIRRGRFDEHIVIYHPDFLSRAGMFLDRLKKRDEITKLEDKSRRRFDEVMKWTAGVNIQDLAKDWFKVPKKSDGLVPETFAHYVSMPDEKPANMGRVRPSGTSEEEQLESTPLEKWWENKERELADGSLWDSLK